MNTKPKFPIGIHFNVPEAEYRLAEGVCQSDLKEVEISPAHYHQRITSPPKPSTDAQVIGTLIHALILCRREDFAVIPDDAPKKPSKSQWVAKKPSPDTVNAIGWWGAFMSAYPDKEYVTKDEAAVFYAMRDAVCNNPTAKSILEREGNNEVACFKVHEPTGLMLKGRADRVTMDNAGLTAISDLKTVQRGGGGALDFSKDIFNWGYHRQAAFYLDLFGASYFVFIVVEKEAPYAVAVYNLTPESINLGRRENERDLALIKQCQDSGEWPAYGSGITSIGVPEWVLRKGLV